MTKQIDSVIKQILPIICPTKDEHNSMKKELNNFLKKLNTEIKKKKIIAQVFVGGSFAKNTLVKKDKYDADVFVRFDKKYKEKELSIILNKLLDSISEKDYLVIHGSRDYFRINLSPVFLIELIPVRKVNSPKESENITDLSYSHVKYIEKKIKSQKVLDDIKVAKAFSHACQCYGAESYISGFSGYSLELLIYYYGSFEKFLNGIIKAKDKEVIDIEKFYKKKQDVLMDLNSSKLISPIILIDPTYKQRNALAALSIETLEKFKVAAKEFLKNPSIKAFEEKKIDLEKIKKDAENKGNEFILIEAHTDKQEGDVAGSKLLKFYRNFEDELESFYEIKNKGFNYNGKQSARFFFVLKSKKEILFDGPFAEDKNHVKEFKKAHKKTFVKEGRIFAKEEFKLKAKEFFTIWKGKNDKKISEMYITKLEII